MKRFGMLAAGLCAAFVLTACNTTESQNTSAGAVGGSKCCATSKACCTKKEGECKAGDKSMGAVSGKGECSATKAECTKTCPAAAKDAPMGAVSEKKSGCCASKCTSAK